MLFSVGTLKDILPLVITLGWVFYYMQVYQMYTTKKRGSVPIMGAIFTMLSSFIWFCYGEGMGDFNIQYSAVLGMIACSSIIYMYYFYCDYDTDQDNNEIDKVKVKVKDSSSNVNQMIK